MVTLVITCTLWLFNIAMENGPFIDGLPIKNGGSFHGDVSHNQRVTGCQAESLTSNSVRRFSTLWWICRTLPGTCWSPVFWRVRRNISDGNCWGLLSDGGSPKENHGCYIYLYNMYIYNMYIYNMYIYIDIYRCIMLSHGHPWRGWFGEHPCFRNPATWTQKTIPSIDSFGALKGLLHV